MKEEMVIKGFEKDSEVFFICGLDVKSIKCKKCDYESHSEGLLRLHRVNDHKLKETFQNLVLGFQCDVREHIELLNSMSETSENFKCDTCEYKTCSKGRLEVHRNEYH